MFDNTTSRTTFGSLQHLPIYVPLIPDITAYAKFEVKPDQLFSRQ